MQLSRVQQEPNMQISPFLRLIYISNILQASTLQYCTLTEGVYVCVYT